MRLSFLSPIPQLRDHIERLWVFESDGRLPGVDMRLFVPNGLAKVVVPFRNGLIGTLAGKRHLSKEHDITLIGICDLPAVIDVEHDTASGSIGIEFNPLGAYRFFRCPQKDISNRIYSLGDVLGTVARRAGERIAEAKEIDDKVMQLQMLLIDLLSDDTHDEVFEYCVRKIKNNRGGIAVGELERETGYSARWLNLTFQRKLGISPKRFCSIMRFHYCYSLFLNDQGNERLRGALYDLYYDQSHFTKEFVRFTGLPPLRFGRTVNAFGRLFYE